jgi:hypothetical protein
MFAPMSIQMYLRYKYSQMLEKQKESHASLIQELHNEIKSLKNLVANRRTTTDAPSFNLSKTPSIPAWQLNGGEAASTQPVSESTNGNVSLVQESGQ